MSNKILFSFKMSETLRRTPFASICPNIDNRLLFALQRWGADAGHDITCGDVIDNFRNIENLGVKGLGVLTASKIRAAFFSYMVNTEKSDSVKILSPKEEVIPEG